MSAKAYDKKTAAFAGFVIQNIPADLTDEEMDGWMDNPSATKKFLSGFKPPVKEVAAQTLPTFDLAPWKTFFLKRYGRKFNLSGLHVPAKLDYPCRAIVIPQGLKNNDVFDACTKAFRTWQYEYNLNAVMDVVKRPNGPYVVWIRDTVEADEDMKNKSADDIVAEGTNTLTLKERMMLELVYFDETGKHLDINSWTLCAGSRDSGGRVPACRWGDVGFNVGRSGLGFRDPGLRARVAVS